MLTEEELKELERRAYSDDAGDRYASWGDVRKLVDYIRELQEIITEYDEESNS